MAKKSTDGKAAIKKFFNENKSLAFMTPILVILIIAAIVINLSLSNDKETAKVDPGVSSSDENIPIDTTQPQVDVLPQIIRSDDSEVIEQQKDPFESPMHLAGVVYSSAKSAAVIEWGGYSYIVGLNDKVGNSDWRVTRIEKDCIALDNGSDSRILALVEKANNHKQ
ncbi:MAG: hypothetical protein ACOYIF_02755 [Acetivibrionales bacterium]|jgi:type II secretory pathway component PulC